MFKHNVNNNETHNAIIIRAFCVLQTHMHTHTWTKGGQADCDGWWHPKARTLCRQNPGTSKWRNPSDAPPASVIRWETTLLNKVKSSDDVSITERTTHMEKQTKKTTTKNSKKGQAVLFVSPQETDSTVITEEKLFWGTRLNRNCHYPTSAKINLEKRVSNILWSETWKKRFFGFQLGKHG